MDEKPSSRKRHRWSLEPGDLVRVSRRPPPPGPWGTVHQEYVIGVVLSTYSANVYEGSSADVLVEGQKMWLESKYLMRIDIDSEISGSI